MTTTAWDAAAEALAGRRGVAVSREAPLGPRTTYRVGGSARVLVEVADLDGLLAVGAVVADSGVEVLVVGRGSNLLVADAGFDGLAVVLGEAFSTVTIEPASRAASAGTVVVRAGGAALLPVVARRTAAAGLRGFEWAVGVPGTIGGAVRMNAGGHGSDLAASLVDATVVDLGAGGAVRRLDAEALGFGYRRSRLRPTEVVVEVTLALTPGDAGEAEALVAEIVAWRRANQPGGQNAGSVFTNPPGDAAGRLIDAAGAKGLRLGTAEVSPKHANFIQADAGGSADDVWRLMAEIRRRVVGAGGPLLHAETVVVGFPPEETAAADPQGDDRR